jgi:ABC-2 type transport system ATP-binding protein
VTALAVENLSHSFGAREALRDVSFAVEPGAFTVLLGLNGAGKTTLVSLVTGLYHARKGEIRVFGRSLRRDRLAALARMGVVFQMPSLDLDLTVAENLRYHAALHGLSRAQARARADEELARLGVGDRAGDKARALSGGLRRRVEIARALLHRPQLLLCDEATVGLDAAMRRDMLAYVRALCRDRGVAVVWATHLIDELDEADAAIVLHRGAVLWRGTAGDLPAHAGAPNIADAFLAITGTP